MNLVQKGCKHERQMGKTTKQQTSQQGSQQRQRSRQHHQGKRRWFLVLFSIALLVTWLWGGWLAIAQPAKQFINQAGFDYTDQGTGLSFSGASEALRAEPQLVDPLGRITGCEGEVLADYQGFSAALYEPDATGTGLGPLVQLTSTEVPDIPNNGIPLGLAPNTRNDNPFFITNSDRGGYNFLFDRARGQLDVGRAYILVINPPANSIFSQRRVLIRITGASNTNVSYTATAIDGLPISADGMMGVNGTLDITSGATTSLVLTALSVRVDVCQAQSVQIVKAGDRAAAEPGDTVIYRVSVRSLSSGSLQNLRVTDTLPLGFSYVDGSARAEFNGATVPVAVSRVDRTLTFQFSNLVLPASTVAQNSVVNLAYAATLSADALRGTGTNSASVEGLRADNQLAVRDGPVFYRLRVQEGILSICGTVIGRVFVDKNFDGEQQPGEPGVPNAVIFMDDGNRITTDANGLFSVANVIAGYRTGVLDLTSLPGYTLAPNLYFIERNSQSRLVHLEPGGLVRMNFAVTPAFKEEGRS